MRVRLILRAWHLHENETKGNENESKWVQFPAAEMLLIKLIRAANRQSPVIDRKFLPLYHKNTNLGTRDFLRLDRNRKPRMKSLWHPGCKNTRFGCILTNATTAEENPICFFYFVSSGGKSKLGEGLEGRINTIPDEEFRERNGALRIQQETDEKGTMFSLP